MEKEAIKSKKVLIAELLELKKDDKEWNSVYSYNQLMRGLTVAQLSYEIKNHG